MTFLFTTLRAFLFFRFFLRLSSFALSEGVDGWGTSSGSVSSRGGDVWCNLSNSEDNSDSAPPFDCSSPTYLFCNGISDIGSLNIYQVNFSYRAQLIEDNTKYIAAIEAAMSRTIEANVLDCTSYETQSVRKLSARRNLAIVAADSLPEDTKSTVTCEVKGDGANFCHVVDAAISFVVDEGTENAAREQILNGIRSAIESEAYVGIENIDDDDMANIVSVAFGLDSDDYVLPVTRSGEEQETDTISRATALTAIGASLVLVIVAASIRRRRARAVVDDENSNFTDADFESERSMGFFNAENQDLNLNTDISLESSALGFETNISSKDEEIDVEAVYDLKSVIPQNTDLL